MLLQKTFFFLHMHIYFPKGGGAYYTFSYGITPNSSPKGGGGVHVPEMPPCLDPPMGLVEGGIGIVVGRTGLIVETGLVVDRIRRSMFSRK